MQLSDIVALLFSNKCLIPTVLLHSNRSFGLKYGKVYIRSAEQLALLARLSKASCSAGVCFATLRSVYLNKEYIGLNIKVPLASLL